MPREILIPLAVLAACLAPAGEGSSNDHGSQPRPLARLPERPAEPPELVTLGRQLFFDTRLSGDDSLSCATCHDPQKAWTDGQATSTGYPGSLYFRNTPTLLNVGASRLVYWDGRMPTADLPTVVRDHISEAHFMQADGRLVLERLAQVPAYRELFERAFQGEVTYGRILKSVAAFVRSLRSESTPMDRYLAGDSQALDADEQAGLRLFTGKASCISCHDGPLLSDGLFHVADVPASSQLLDDPERAITFRRFFASLGTPGFETMLVDPGRYGITKQTADRGCFKTPSLREVSRTAPYMHDGTLQNLSEVLQHHGATPGARDAIALTDQERSQVVAFLKALSSTAQPVTTPGRLAYAALPLPTRPEPDSTATETAMTSAEARTQPRPLAALPPVPVPPDNPLTEAKAELGQMLYFDSRLSGDISTSCASCHDPALGWGDGGELSRGYPGAMHWRNSQTVINSAYLAKLFWAGESPSLEAQAKSAITGNLAGNGDPLMIEERLSQVPDYVRRFRAAFGALRPTFGLVLKAIATYERTLVSDDSPFDRFMRGDPSALSEESKAGMALFTGKARCNSCHDGALLTDESYHALDVPDNPSFETVPLRQVALRYQHYGRGVSEEVYRNARTDLGLYYTTKQELDRGRFRTPPLRYLAYTAPYMHNGVFWELEEVVDFYNAGGGDSPSKDSRLQPLGLSESERSQLVSFLESLSGREIRVVSPQLPPYAQSGR